MRPISRFALATLAGLVLGAIVHLVIVLAMPSFSEHDAYSRLEPAVNREKPGFLELSDGKDDMRWLRYRDTAMMMSACPYDLTAGPYVVTVKGDVPFESVAFHAHRRNVFYSVTDQAQVRGQMGFLVATNGQMAQLLQSGEYDEFYSSLIKVTAPDEKGLVVIRALAPSPSYRKLSEDAVAHAECRPLTDEDRAQEPEEELSIPHDPLPPRRGR